MSRCWPGRWLTELAGAAARPGPGPGQHPIQTNGTLLRPRHAGDAQAARHPASGSAWTATPRPPAATASTPAAGTASTPCRRPAPARLARFREIYSGILCTIDVDNDPVATYEALLKFSPPAGPPAAARQLELPAPGSGYADWLIAVFERWYSAPEQETQIRLFTELIQLVLGSPGAVEGLGLRPSTLIVVDTDGSIKQLDSLSSAYDGAADTGLQSVTDAFDAALDHPTTVARQIGADALSAQCQACPVLRDLRRRSVPASLPGGAGFRHPSVYCADLMRLIDPRAADGYCGDAGPAQYGSISAVSRFPRRRPGLGMLRGQRLRVTGAGRPRALLGAASFPEAARRWPGWPLPSACPGGPRPGCRGTWPACPGPILIASASSPQAARSEA